MPVQKARKLRAKVATEGHICEMKVDSVSDFSILTEETFRHRQHCNEECNDTDRLLFNSGQLSAKSTGCYGFLQLHVEYKEFAGLLTVLVARGTCNNLLGVDRFRPLAIIITGVSRVEKLTVVDSVLSELSEVFEESLRNYVGPPVSLHTDSDIQTVRLKA